MWAHQKIFKKLSPLMALMTILSFFGQNPCLAGRHNKPKKPSSSAQTNTSRRAPPTDIQFITLITPPKDLIPELETASLVKIYRPSGARWPTLGDIARDTYSADANLGSSLNCETTLIGLKEGVFAIKEEEHSLLAYTRRQDTYDSVHSARHDSARYDSPTLDTLTQRNAFTPFSQAELEYWRIMADRNTLTPNEILYYRTLTLSLPPRAVRFLHGTTLRQQHHSTLMLVSDRYFDTLTNDPFYQRKNQLPVFRQFSELIYDPKVSELLKSKPYHFEYNRGLGGPETEFSWSMAGLIALQQVSGWERARQLPQVEKAHLLSPPYTEAIDRSAILPVAPAHKMEWHRIDDIADKAAIWGHTVHPKVHERFTDPKQYYGFNEATIISQTPFHRLLHRPLRELLDHNHAYQKFEQVFRFGESLNLSPKDAFECFMNYSTYFAPTTLDAAVFDQRGEVTRAPHGGYPRAIKITNRSALFYKNFPQPAGMNKIFSTQQVHQLATHSLLLSDIEKKYFLPALLNNISYKDDNFFGTDDLIFLEFPNQSNSPNISLYLLRPHEFGPMIYELLKYFQKQLGLNEISDLMSVYGNTKFVFSISLSTASSALDLHFKGIPVFDFQKNPLNQEQILETWPHIKTSHLHWHDPRQSEPNQRANLYVELLLGDYRVSPEAKKYHFPSTNHEVPIFPDLIVTIPFARALEIALCEAQPQECTDLSDGFPRGIYRSANSFRLFQGLSWAESMYHMWQPL